MEPIEPTQATKLAALEESENRRSKDERARRVQEQQDAYLLSLGYLPNRHGRRAYEARNRKFLAAHPERNMAAAPEHAAAGSEDDHG